jgi:hypothetical protein
VIELNRRSLAGLGDGIARWSWVLISAFLITYVARALGEFDHNDHEYGVAPFLLTQGRLYRDVAYDQTPLAAHLYSAIGTLTGWRAHYAVISVLSVAAVITACFVSAATAQRLAARPGVWFVAAALALINPQIYSDAFEAGNSGISLVLFAVALNLLVRGADRSGPMAAALTGLLMGLATSSKLTYAVPGAAVGLVYLARPGRARCSAAFAAGAIIGGAPMIWHLARSPAEFMFFNFEFHFLQNRFRDTFDARHNWWVKAIWRFGTASIPAAVLVLSAIQARIRKPEGRIPAPGRELAALGFVGVFAIAAGAAPAAYTSQYWSAAGLIVVIVAVVAAARIAWDLPQFRALALAGVCLLLLINGAVNAAMAGRSLARGQYDLVAMLRTRSILEQALAKRRDSHPACFKSILSASATPLVGLGVPLSPGSADGGFAFRIHEVASPDDPVAQRFTDVGRYLAPDTGLLIGYYADSPFESRMLAYAREQHFIIAATAPYFGTTLTLYLPQACSTR